MRNIAIVIFDDVEVLDFCGPFEVFSVAGGHGQDGVWRVFTVAHTTNAISTRGGLSVNPTYTLETCPQPDIVVVPGGRGTRREMVNDALLSWIRRVSDTAELILSVCTGALILANAGLLEGLNVTTHHEALALLGDLAPTAHICPYERFVDNGRVVTAAGISAGIDMALYIVARLLGPEKALTTARHMEYEWLERGRWEGMLPGQPLSPAGGRE